ncbi:MAG: PAS domain S-box protein [Chloroflexota bacterium]|nr:PAS domain S-box protein [Chloroflexota bacterium]
MFPNLRLRWKFLLAFGAAIALMLLEATLVYRSTVIDQQAVTSADRTHDILAQAEAARDALTGMSDAYTDFLLSGRDVFLDGYQSNKQTLLTKLALLQRQDDGIRNEGARWQQLLKQVNAWDSEVVQPGVAERRRLSGAGSSADTLNRFVTRELNQPRLETMHSLLAQAMSAEQALLDDEYRHSSEDHGQVRFVLVWGTGVAAGLGLLLAFLLERSIARPLSRLPAAAAEVAAGNFAKRIGMDRRDEIGLLANGFDDMADKLQVMVAHLEAAVRLTKEREEHLRLVMDSVADGLMTFDELGTILSMNPTAIHIFGYASQEVEGRNVDLILPDNQWRVCRLDADLRRTGSLSSDSCELIGQRRDGSTFPLDLRLSRTSSGGKPLLVGVVRDISERKLLEEERSRQHNATVVERNTLNAILDGMADVVFAVDRTGQLIRANEAAGAMTGYAPEEMVGQLIYKLFPWEDEAGHPIERDAFLFLQTMPTGEVREARQWYFRKPDGHRIPVAVRSTPVTDSSGSVTAAVQVIRDITREREADELKDHIISLVSHELRTPLAHIKGFASSLIDRDVTWDAATQRDFIVEIDREADRLTALVADLLDMSKIEAAGSDYLEKIRSRPEIIAEQSLKAVEAATAGHNVINHVPADLPDILADAVHLQRVIGNLVENAAKYSEPGTPVRLSAKRRGDELVWAVEDEGPGVPMAYRDRIFDKFFRIKTGRPRPPGTGLGLPICKGIVQAHGGRIWLENAEPRGSRFCFTTPLAGSPVPAAAEEVGARSLAARS